MLSKNILIFMDGTRNKPSDERLHKHSNVFKLYEATSSAHDGCEAHVKYVRGVGTSREERKTGVADDLRLYRVRRWNPPANPIKRVAKIVADIPKKLALEFGASAVGWGVADRIREAYGFLCRHYEDGDQVFLLGFSRGAFEARSLAGFVEEVGLLLRSAALGPDARRLVDMAYEIYRLDDPKARAFLSKFLRRMVHAAVPAPGGEGVRSTVLPVYFIGVWDTVAALGAEASGSKRLKNEHVPFVRRHTTHHRVDGPAFRTPHVRHALAVHELRTSFEPTLFHDLPAKHDIRQCWFAGAHADVGGGYKDAHLSDVALLWMAEQMDEVAGTQPVERTPVPKTPAATRDLLPHHEIDGPFIRAVPLARQAVAAFERLEPAVAATFSVHCSALGRLAHDAALVYDDYPFERVLHLDTRYPGRVAHELHKVDDALVALQINLVREREKAIAAQQSAAAPAHWVGARGVVELKAALRSVAALALAPLKASSNGASAAQALALLHVLDQQGAIDALVARAMAAAAAGVERFSKPGWVPSREDRGLDHMLTSLVDIAQTSQALLPQHMRGGTSSAYVQEIVAAREAVHRRLPLLLFKPIKLRKP